MMNSRQSVVIIGEGETEWFYFDNLRVANRYRFKLLPDMSKHSEIQYVVDLAEKYVDQRYDYVICLIDMDVMTNSANVKKYQTEKKRLLKYAKNKSTIWFIETSPCTEFWFLLHFLPSVSSRSYLTCEELLPELRKYMPGYEKSKKYFKKTKLYEYLTKYGNLDMAISNSEKIRGLSLNNPEDYTAYSEIHKVLQLLKELEKN